MRPNDIGKINRTDVQERQNMKKVALAILFSVPLIAWAQARDAQVILKDSRVFSCDDPKGSNRKCLGDEARFPVSGELIVQVRNGVCEQHTYSMGGGDVYRSDDRLSQIQFPASIEREVRFQCDNRGNPI
jgi:hypothetical protein